MIQFNKLLYIINNINIIDTIYIDVFNITIYENEYPLFYICHKEDYIIFGLEQKYNQFEEDDISSIIFIDNNIKIKMQILLTKILYSNIKIISYDIKEVLEKLNKIILLNTNKINIYKDLTTLTYINNIKINKRNNFFNFELQNNLIKSIIEISNSLYLQISNYQVNNNNLYNIYKNIIKVILDIQKRGILLQINPKHTVKYNKIYNNLNNGLYFPNYNITSTITGRLSSDYHIWTDDFKKNIKSQFIKGSIISIDFSQIELNILANLSNNEIMLNDLNNNLDLHLETSNKLNLNNRQLGKIVNFSILYGISNKNLAKKINKSIEETTNIIEQYFNKYVNLKNWMQNEINKSTENKTITNPYNFNMTVENDLILTQKEYINKIKHKTINYIIQSTSAIYVLDFIQTLHNLILKYKLNSYIIGTIHDSIEIDLYYNEKQKLLELLTICEKQVKPTWMKCQVKYKIKKN
jgi:hypothetical protein